MRRRRLYASEQNVNTGSRRGDCRARGRPPAETGRSPARRRLRPPDAFGAPDVSGPQTSPARRPSIRRRARRVPCRSTASAEPAHGASGPPPPGLSGSRAASREPRAAPPRRWVPCAGSCLDGGAPGLGRHAKCPATAPRRQSPISEGGDQRSAVASQAPRGGAASVAEGPPAATRRPRRRGRGPARRARSLGRRPRRPRLRPSLPPPMRSAAVALGAPARRREAYPPSIAPRRPLASGGGGRTVLECAVVRTTCRGSP